MSCDNGLDHLSKRAVSAYRTDECDGLFGRSVMKISECHLPQHKKTFAANENVEEEVDGVKYTYKCVEHGDSGVKITHNAVRAKTNNDKVENPGFCTEGTKQWIPEMQIEDADFVRRCNPETFQMEVIACRSHNGSFVPVDSESTEEYYDETHGQFFTFTKCEVVGDLVTLSSNVTVTPPADLDRELAGVDGCVIELKENKTIIKPGEEAVHENIVHDCLMVGRRFRSSIVGCVSHFGNFLQIGENVTEGEVAMQFYNSLCMRIDGGVKLEIEHLSDMVYPGHEEQKTYPHRDIPRCADDTSSHGAESPIYRDGLAGSCSVDHRGRETFTVIGCVKPGSKHAWIWLGKTEIVGSSEMKCTPTADGKAELVAVPVTASPETSTVNVQSSTTPTDPCREHEDAGREWVEGDFVRACQYVQVFKDGRKIRMNMIVRCITEGGELAVGEEKVVNGHTYSCVRIGRTEARVEHWTPGDVPPPRCPNGRRLNETWIDGEIEVTCVQVADQMLYTTIGCSTIVYENMTIPLDEAALVNGRMLRCVSTGDGEAQLQVECAGGKKQGERWLEDKLVKQCVGDLRMKGEPLFLTIVVVGCVYDDRIEVPVGDTHYASFETCSCIEKGNPENVQQFPVTDAELKCAKHLPPTPESDIPDCSKYQNIDKEWVQGNFVKACKQVGVVEEKRIMSNTPGMDGYPIFGVVSYRCITPEGDRIVVEEEKLLDNGSVYDCVKVNKTEAKLVLLSPEEAALPRKCDNGKRIGDVWEEKRGPSPFASIRELTCLLDSGKTKIAAVACITLHQVWRFRTRIPVGETIGESQYGQDRCVPTEDGLAKHEHINPICLNGRKIGDEWKDGNMIKTCIYDDGIQDAERAIIVVKECIAGDELVPVGEKKEVFLKLKGKTYTCHCVDERSGELRTYQVESAQAICYPPGDEKPKEAESVNSTELIGHCNSAADVDKEWKNGNIVMACKATVEGGQDGGPIRRVLEEMAVRCIIREGLEIPVGKSFNEESGAQWVCERQGQTGAAIHASPPGLIIPPEEVPTTTVPPAHCKNGKLLNEEWIINGSIVWACKDANGDLIEVAVRCIIRAGVEIPVGKSFNEGSGAQWVCAKKGETGAGIRYLPAGAVNPPEDGPTTTVQPTQCANGKLIGEEWEDRDTIKKCVYGEGVEAGQAVVVVTFCDIEGTRVPVGEKQSVFLGSKGEVAKCHCVIGADTTGLGLLNKHHIEYAHGVCYPIMDTTATPQSPAQTTTGSRSTRKPREPKWCNKKTVGQETAEFGDKCVRKGRYGAELVRMNKTDLVCDNGQATGETKLNDDDVIRKCDKDLKLVAKGCIPRGGKELSIGESMRDDDTQYRCEKHGQTDAKLVTKSFSQLCEEGDQTVEAWVSDGVLRDCEHIAGKQSIVHARMCILDDLRIIRVGEEIVDEFMTWKCVRVGDFDAKIEEDESRFHPDFFDMDGACANGKREGDEWTERGVRRACRARDLNSVIVDLGCVVDDEKIIDVGTQTSWQDKSDASTVINHTLFCDKGRQGWGAEVYHSVEMVRVCENGRREGEEWEHQNVLRTCREVEDKMVVVALYCVFGNETMEIGELQKISDLSTLECARVGEHDAATVIDTSIHNLECANGKKLNEEWTNERKARMACRIRDNHAQIVTLGCVLGDGRVLGLGETEAVHETQPGYETLTKMTCMPTIKEGTVLLVGEVERTPDQHDEKNPCGEHKYKDVWAKDRFLKKCKVIEGNLLSAVTIGCVTLKDTHVLEGEAVDEDDYHITCKRNEDGTLEIHYAFSFTEESKAYHNHPH